MMMAEADSFFRETSFFSDGSSAKGIHAFPVSERNQKLFSHSDAGHPSRRSEPACAVYPTQVKAGGFIERITNTFPRRSVLLSQTGNRRPPPKYYRRFIMKQTSVSFSVAWDFVKASLFEAIWLFAYFLGTPSETALPFPCGFRFWDSVFF
ncbi:MAG: hypothetical protein ACI3XR_04635 [Eubacteriales bacterium]